MKMEAVIMNTVGTTDGNAITRSGKEENCGDFLAMISQLLGDGNTESFIGNRKEEIPVEVLEQASAMLNQNPILLNSFTESGNVEGMKDLIMAMGIESDKINPLTYKINLLNMDKEVSTLIANTEVSEGNIIADGNQLVTDTELKSEKSNEIIENDVLVNKNKEIFTTEKPEIQTQNRPVIDDVLEIGLEEQSNNIKSSESSDFELGNELKGTVNTHENIQNPKVIYKAENEIEILQSPVVSEDLAPAKSNVANQPQEFEKAIDITSMDLNPVKLSNEDSNIEFTKATTEQPQEYETIAQPVKVNKVLPEPKQAVKSDKVLPEARQIDKLTTSENYETDSLDYVDNGFINATSKDVHVNENQEQVVKVNDKSKMPLEVETQNDVAIPQADEKVYNQSEVKKAKVDEELHHQRDTKIPQNVKGNVTEADFESLYSGYTDYNTKEPIIQNAPLDYVQTQSINVSPILNTEYNVDSSLPNINGIENTADTNLVFSDVESSIESLAKTEKNNLTQSKLNIGTPELNELNVSKDTSVTTNRGNKEIEFDTESKFYQTINAVKKTLKTDDTKSGEIIVNIDELQKQVNNVEFRNIQKVKVETKLTDEFDIQNQVLDGLSKQLKTGLKEEFTIQLAPEGLGKITVKFVKDAEKIILNMTATNESTVKLLSERLGDLQNSLRVHNAEINNIAVQKSENASEHMAHSNLQQSFSDGQNFNRDSRSYFSNGNSESYYNNFMSNSNYSEIEQQAEVIPSKKLNSMLNVYV